MGEREDRTGLRKFTHIFFDLGNHLISMGDL
jgi:hypothetical protein